MTRQEFHGQFVRLCKGFKYEATEEQAEAWYRRIGHVGVEPWSESVTNLLCASHFPRDLDAVMKVVEIQAQASRSKAILREKRTAPQVEQGVQRNLQEWKKRVVVERVSCHLCLGDAHDGSNCWPWLDDAERERRLALPFWKDRARHPAQSMAS